MNEIIIFGSGGVGSWIANFITRKTLDENSMFTQIETIRIVDFDEIEQKNLKRQNFYNNDLGLLKSDTTIDTIYKINSELHLCSENIKIEEPTDLLTFNENALAIICTDNIISKKLISKYFINFIIINCDKDFVEIKNYLEEEDKKAWDTGGGYSNKQNINSNLFACIVTLNNLETYGLYQTKKWKYTSKVESYTKRKTEVKR